MIGLWEPLTNLQPSNMNLMLHVVANEKNFYLLVLRYLFKPKISLSTILL